MTPRRAGERTDRAEHCVTRYTTYSRHISQLESHGQVSQASSMRAEAIEKFDEGDRVDYSVFLRLVHGQMAIYGELQNNAAIDELHCTVVGKFRRIFGHRHWKTITAMREYGQMLCGEKRYEQAEALYRTLVDEVDQAHWPETVAVLCIFNALGAVYAKLRKLKEAETILVRALVGFQRKSGEKDLRTLTAAFNLGDVYQDRGKISHAIHTYHRAAHGFKDVMGTSYKTTITAFTQLAAPCSARRAFIEAEEAYTLALQGLEETARQGSIDALILKLDLGILYRNVERLEAAEELIQKVCQDLKDARSGYAAGALACLGTVYARQNRADEAEASFADAIEEFAVCDEEYSVMSYAASFGLGNLLLSQRRLAEAEAMYRQAWEGARSVGGPRHATCCIIAGALCAACEEQGNYEEATRVFLIGGRILCCASISIR